MRLRLASALIRQGQRVDLVVFDAVGPLRDQVPLGARLVELKRGPLWKGQLHALRADPAGLWALLRPVLLPMRPPRRLGSLPGLVGYLRRERPRAVIAATRSANLQAVWARTLSRAPTVLVVGEHSTLSRAIARSRRWKHRFVRPLVRRTYLKADAVVAVSQGVADDLARETGIPRERIQVVHNPVVTPELKALAEAPLGHPWIASGGPPLVLGVGRLVDAKDFPTLLRAFARARQQQRLRLMILGEGPRRPMLEALASSLGVAEDVSFPGFTANPYAWMARASLFALSSAWEGLPGVLIEALACGCPVVSTDCPSGASEILADGAYGALVPVGDDAALARAMLTTLHAPPPTQRLKARAEEFSADRAAARYLSLIGACPGAGTAS